MQILQMHTIDSESDLPLSHPNPGNNRFAGVDSGIFLCDSLQLQSVPIAENLGSDEVNTTLI